MDKIKRAIHKSILGIQIKIDRRKSLRWLLMSVVSFIVVFTLLTGMSFSWFTLKVSELNASEFVLDCSKGLRVNDTGTSQLSFQTSPKELTPASSVTGRNLYFPTDGSDFSSTTETMTFRSANAGDKNQNYIQIDFTLTAQQNHTALYINADKTSILVKSVNENDFTVSQAASLRAALWSSTAEGGVPNTPIVFNPTASTVYTAAVADVDRSSGAFIASGRQVAHAFSEYAFGGTPVATLSKGVATEFSYIIWLEGTDPKCTDKIISKDIQVNLAFTTSWDKTQTIRFEATPDIKSKLDDKTYSLSLYYFDLDNENKEVNTSEFNMYEVSADSNNKQWYCNIPGDMRMNISFILRPRSADSGLPTYEFRYDTANRPTLDRGANRYYVADNLTEALNGYLGHGHWIAVGDSDGAGHDDGGGFEGDDF